MNLVIDCFKLVKGAGKSIGIYNLAKSITGHLGERVEESVTGAKRTEESAGSEKGAGAKAADTILVLGNAYNRKDFDVPGVTFVEMKGNPLNKLYCIFWELVLVRKYARKYQADRVLFPRGFRPFGKKGSIGMRGDGKSIKDTIIIHDLIPFYYHKHYPDVFNKLENAYIMYRLKVSMKKADSIITISQYSKDDILDKVPGCEGKITVINNGFNDVSYQKDEKSADEEDTANARSLTEKPEYIVAMTSGLPHKNAKGVLKAYETYYKKAENPLELVVIGVGDTSFYAEMDAEVSAHVTCHKFFEKFDEMCRVAAGAKAYLFLSYVEGFGFPPLEAMQLGVPVVCSDRSSLPEVVADAGLLVEPDDLDKVAQALIQVTTNEELRQELIGKGYENIKRFSWDSRTELYWKELFR